MEPTMNALVFAIFLVTLLASSAECSLESGRIRYPSNTWRTRGYKRGNRKLQLTTDYLTPVSKSSVKKSGGVARSISSPYDTTPAPKGKAANKYVSTPAEASEIGGRTFTYGSSGYTDGTSALLAYTDPCQAAADGAEFKTGSFLPVYYEYEVLTSNARDILQIADILDKASQHFLAVWMVDCTASLYNGGNRKRQRDLQQFNVQPALPPIVGVGMGERDTVLLGGTTAEQCSVLAGMVASGQVCYKVIASLVVYLDETAQAPPTDQVQLQALETLTVGMNYGTTDFTQLDPNIYQVRFVQAYDVPPTDLLASNWDMNKRSWDPTIQENPFIAQAPEEQAPVSNNSRSGGAKFGIAFATLVCIALAAFLSVYLYQNRDRLCYSEKPPANRLKHFNLEDPTQASTRTKASSNRTHASTPYDLKKARVIVNDTGSDFEVNVTFPSCCNSPSPDEKSMDTRPLSPDPETPRFPKIMNNERFNKSPMEESNIITPRSDWSTNRSTISEMTDPMPTLATPDDRSRIRVSLNQDTIRSSSSRKRVPKGTESVSSNRYISSNRSYEVEDTVQL